VVEKVLLVSDLYTLKLMKNSNFTPPRGDFCHFLRGLGQQLLLAGRGGRGAFAIALSASADFLSPCLAPM